MQNRMYNKSLHNASDFKQRISQKKIEKAGDQQIMQLSMYENAKDIILNIR